MAHCTHAYEPSMPPQSPQLMLPYAPHTYKFPGHVHHLGSMPITSPPYPPFTLVYLHMHLSTFVYEFYFYLFFTSFHFMVVVVGTCVWGGGEGEDVPPLSYIYFKFWEKLFYMWSILFILFLYFQKLRQEQWSNGLTSMTASKSSIAYNNMSEQRPINSSEPSALMREYALTHFCESFECNVSRMCEA